MDSLKYFFKKIEMYAEKEYSERKLIWYLKEIENFVREWRKSIKHREKVNSDKEDNEKNDSEDSQNNSLVTLYEGTDVSLELKGTIQPVEEERSECVSKEKRKAERKHDDDKDRDKRIRREDKDKLEFHRNGTNSTESDKLENERRESDSNNVNVKDQKTYSSSKSSSSSSYRFSPNSEPSLKASPPSSSQYSSNHSNKSNSNYRSRSSSSSKYREKVGEMTLSKEKLDDSSAAPLLKVIDLFDETDKSEKTNCVKRQSDNSNNSTNSLITNTEEEHQRIKATKEETGAKISSPLTSPPRPILLRTEERQIADYDENMDPLEYLLEIKKNRKRAPVCDGTAKSRGILEDRVNDVDNDIISDTRNIPFDILKPKLEKYSVQELMTIEKDNPELIKSTEYLWRKFVERDFVDNVVKVNNESYKNMYFRLKQEKDDKFSISISKMKERYKTESEKHQKVEEPRMNINRKPAQYIKNKQQRNGTYVSSGSKLDTVKKVLIRDTIEENRNSSSKHDIKIETKYKEKFGDMTLKKEKIDDSPTAPVLKSINIFNDADQLGRKNYVKRQSDTPNKSRNGLQTKTEDEHRSKKPTNEKTVATCMDTVNKSPPRDSTDQNKMENKKSKPTRLMAQSRKVFMTYQYGFNK